MFAAISAPGVSYSAMSPLLALAIGGVVVLMLGVINRRSADRALVPFFTILSIGTSAGLAIWQWGTKTTTLAGALTIDKLGLLLLLIVLVGALAATLLSIGEQAPEQSGHGEYYTLLLFAALGMGILVQGSNLVTLFLGLELFSISFYILCASELKRSSSLESGLKYLIIGSVGSVTLLYGFALLYGATGSTDLSGISQAIYSGDLDSDALLLFGVGLTLIGLLFKSSVAPFHQWTPDVYQGAPTPITTFMAVTTKVAAFGLMIRLLDGTLFSLNGEWGPIAAVLAAVTIIVGNVGALGQSSLKRMLAYSSVAQAGYILAGIVVATEVGVKATIFYLAGYLLMNVSAFAVLIAKQRSSNGSDEISSLRGLGFSQPLLAWPLTISMLALAGFPATVGFIGKITLIEAAVDGNYTWLAVMIAVGSMISLGYYLKVVAVLWQRDQATDNAPTRALLPTAIAVTFALATVFFGIIASPLFDLANQAAKSLAGLH